MKKKILILLEELHNLGIVLPRIITYKDHSGCVIGNLLKHEKEIFSFESEKELIEGLKDKIKELKNK